MSEIQWFTFIVVILGLILETRWAFKNRESALMAIPWILLLTHYTLFYTSLIIDPSYDIPVRFSVWSSILRGHEIITVVGYSLYRKNQGRIA